MVYVLPTSPAVGASFSTGADRYQWNGTSWVKMSTTSPTSLPGDWITTQGITFTTTGTATSKPATRVIDYVRYRKTGFKNYEIEYKYAQTIQGSGGTGDLLVTLPGGLQFDQTVHPIYAGAAGVGLASYSLPNADATIIAYGVNDADAAVIPYSATQFRMWVYMDLSAARVIVTPGAYGFASVANCSYNIRMNITAV